MDHPTLPHSPLAESPTRARACRTKFKNRLECSGLPVQGDRRFCRKLFHGLWLAGLILFHPGLGETGPATYQLTPDPAGSPFQDGTPSDVVVTGERKLWHKITLTLKGPFARERDIDPNPFTDYRLTGIFTHPESRRSYTVPGYFAADGRAAESSAEAGSCWRVHFSPDRTGRWEYELILLQGRWIAVEPAARAHARRISRRAGWFDVGPSDKSEPDFRARGRLQYVGHRYLRCAGSGEYFLKVGADSPENLLGYQDFDGTVAPARPVVRPGENAPAGRLKTWSPHLRDWRPGDPTWQADKGRGLIGALNYLASRGMNAVSLLTYNAGGDGDDVWPFVERNAKFHYDCPKLDQWAIVFEHANARGLLVHIKLQEQEIDDNRPGPDGPERPVPEALDGGDLGPERKLYLRELVARFAHLPALQWNLGEENSQTTAQIRAMASWLRDLDPYDHPIVVHTFSHQQDRVYTPLLGDRAALTGVSLQNAWDQAHRRTLHWVSASARTGHPWVVCHDEQNPASAGVPPDPGYGGFSGWASDGRRTYSLHDIRKYCLWGTFMAGGAGVEYYFGYTLPQNDLQCEDWRSREQSWHYGRLALEFFRKHAVPFWSMTNANALVENPGHENSRYALARAGDRYVVYLPAGGTTTLDLQRFDRTFVVEWYNPRDGGELRVGSVRRVRGPGPVFLGAPPSHPEEDWVILVRQTP